MVSLAFVTNGFEGAVELSQARLPPDSPAAKLPPAARTSGRAATASSAAVAVATTSTASAAAAKQVDTVFAHWGLAADGTHVADMARTCGCGHAFAPDTVFCSACGVHHHAVETATAAATTVAPAAA